MIKITIFNLFGQFISGVYKIVECVIYVAVTANCDSTRMDEISFWEKFCFNHPWVSRFRTLGIRWRVWQVENLHQDRAIGTELDISHISESCDLTIRSIRTFWSGVLWADDLLSDFDKSLLYASGVDIFASVGSMASGSSISLTSRSSSKNHIFSSGQRYLEHTRRISVLNKFVHFLE